MKKELEILLLEKYTQRVVEIYFIMLLVETQSLIKLVSSEDLLLNIMEEHFLVLMEKDLTLQS